MCNGEQFFLGSKGILDNNVRIVSELIFSSFIEILVQLEIHNHGDIPINVTDLELVWNYAGRNTGGRLPFGKRLVGAGSTSVLYEVDGIWMEELTTGTISATVTLEGGSQLFNTLRWNEG